MPSSLPRTLTVLTVLLCSFKAGLAATNPVVSGNARFTVVTPNCIRMEYSADGHFVDQPSLFAANRASHFDGFQLQQGGKATVIDTGAIRLIYTPDGKPFSPDNLKAAIKTDDGPAAWTPGAANPGNLGGTIRTLDQVSGPVDLGEGVLSRDGWFLLDDSKSPLLTSDWVQSRPASAGTDWYLFGYGSDYRAALKSLTAAGGSVPMPRKYALGAWYSRYWPYSSNDYRQIIQEYGQHDFPLDNIVMDMDWHRDGWTGWSWNRELLPDAENLLTWFHQQGLHVTLNLHPADGVGPQEDSYDAFMRDMGADPATKKTIPFDAGDKKYMDTLFADVFAPLEKEGVDFWWLDWQQYPYTRSVPDLTNLFWLNTLLYDRTAQNDQRGLSFSRWAGWGDHRHPIHFSGDANTGFPMLAFEVPFTSTAGNVGCFFWSHDIGGHMGGRNEESYTRWVQFGATSPVLRSHSTRDKTTDRRPWNYPKWAEDSMRISFHLRDELFPYLYTSAWETCSQTVPLDRPLYLDYPREEKAYHNAQEYLIGDNLLAAPVVVAGTGPGRVGAQTVWFPKAPTDTWFNTFTGERYAGGTEALVSADINEFPLYARGGVPIPMQPYTPHMTTAPLDKLVLRCYPGDDGKTGSSVLYEDDGVTTAYRHGESALTPLSYTRRGDTVTVRVNPTTGRFKGEGSLRSIVVELPATAKAIRATCDGKPLPIAYDPATFTNTVTAANRAVGKPTTIVVTVASADFDRIHALAASRRIAGILGHTAPDLKSALADPGLTDDQRDALLATAGIGYVAKNQGAYLYHGQIKDEFFAPRGAVDGDKIAVVLEGRTRSVSGEPIEVSGTSIKRRGVTITRPAQISFALDNRQYVLPETAQTENDLFSEDNVAGTARVTVSGSEDGYGPEGAVDGIPSGYPDDKSREWSAGQNEGAWLQLSWDTPQTVDRVLLFDRPNTTDQVTAGTVTFSDGTTLPVGPLPDNGKTGFELKFPAKTITWLKFTITGVKDGTQNAGLSEIAVFRAK